MLKNTRVYRWLTDLVVAKKLLISLHAKLIFRAKKSLCQNVAVQKFHRKNVTLGNNAAVKNCHREKCKSVSSCKSDAVQKCHLVQKWPSVQKCPLVQKWRSCKRVAVQKCPLVLKWRSCKSDTHRFLNICFNHGVCKFQLHCSLFWFV